MRIVIFGLSLASSWGNGHAVTYRSLIKGLHGEGHDVVFFERDVAWYHATRDFEAWPYCRLIFYDRLSDLAQYREIIEGCDAVIIGTYVADASILYRISRKISANLLALYDIDTPVTLSDLRSGRPNVFDREMIADCDLYLSFTGGPLLTTLEQEFHARFVRPLYCSVDPAFHSPLPSRKRYTLSYLGTYSTDRQSKLEELLYQPALRLPESRFIVGGAQYPATLEWPGNIEHIDHIPPADHPDFYQSSRTTLNLTRAEMVAVGYSPSIRLFEAASCGTPILTDEWPGLSDFFTPGQDCLLVRDRGDVIQALAKTDDELHTIASAARKRTLQYHTGSVRARELIAAFRSAQEHHGKASALVEPIAGLNVE